MQCRWPTQAGHGLRATLCLIGGLGRSALRAAPGQGSPSAQCGWFTYARHVRPLLRSPPQTRTLAALFRACGTPAPGAGAAHRAFVFRPLPLAQRRSGAAIAPTLARRGRHPWLAARQLALAIAAGRALPTLCRLPHPRGQPGVPRPACVREASCQGCKAPGLFAWCATTACSSVKRPRS